MPPIAWTDRMSVGVTEVDRQHRRLLELFNRLEEELARGGVSRGVRALFADLDSYTRYHFNGETNLLRIRASRDLDGQRKAHGEFMAKIAGLGALLGRDGDQAAALAASRFLRGWILRHIVVADRLAFADHGVVDAATASWSRELPAETVEPSFTVIDRK
jgi:hemerythrin-like metal-binding protein